jgi:hypothetical protein
MRLHRFPSVSFICAVIAAAAALPLRSFAAAQLAAGAKTSAQPTSTNPQQRQLQITFDPETEGGSFNVTSFQLSVQFDPTKVQVSSQSDIQLVGPYTDPGMITETSEGVNAPPPSGGSSSSVIDNQGGFVNFIGGHAPVGNTMPGDVDIFSIIFTLTGGTSFDDPLFFKIFGNPGNNDFVGGTDPNNPSNTTTTPAAQVIPTILIGSFNQFANQIAQGPAGGVPLPGALWTGVMAAGVVIAFARRLRSRLLTAA